MFIEEMGRKGVCVCVCLKENENERKKGSEATKNITDKEKKRERSFPECFLRMIILPSFIRSEGAHRESGFERLAWFRNILG
jgi:predicted nucleic acid-binding Zn ribbon protein